jgi:predicted component of type VI protein secretion system
MKLTKGAGGEQVQLVAPSLKDISPTEVTTQVSPLPTIRVMRERELYSRDKISHPSLWVIG